MNWKYKSSFCGVMKAMEKFYFLISLSKEGFFWFMGRKYELRYSKLAEADLLFVDSNSYRPR